jgi:rubrerythrin
MANSKEGNDTRRVLTLCAELERTTGGMYRDLAAAHAGDPQLARLWLKTAQEEDNHARQFELARMYGDQLGAVGVTAVTARALVDVAQEMRRRLATEARAPVAALRTAIELEERLADFHLTAITAFRSERLRKLFGAMMAADRGHVEALRAALAARR